MNNNKMTMEEAVSPASLFAFYAPQQPTSLLLARQDACSSMAEGKGLPLLTSAAAEQGQSRAK